MWHNVKKKELHGNESWEGKKTEKLFSQPFRNSQHPLLNINTAISISRSLSWGLTTTLHSGQGSPRKSLLWATVTHPEEADFGLRSCQGSFNHHDQKVNTAHESITQGRELMAPHDLGVSLIQATNLSDRQIIRNLLDWEEKEIFTLIIHSVHGCFSSPSEPQRVGPNLLTDTQKCNAWIEMPLSLSELSHSLPLPLPPSFCLFLHPFVFLCSSVCLAILVDWW